MSQGSLFAKICHISICINPIKQFLNTYVVIMYDVYDFGFEMAIEAHIFIFPPFENSL